MAVVKLEDIKRFLIFDFRLGTVVKGGDGFKFFECYLVPLGAMGVVAQRFRDGHHG